MDDVVLAVDLGGTKTAVALVDRAGSTGPVHTVATPAQEGPAAVIAVIADAAQHLLADADGAPRVRAVGVGTPGVVDVSSGTIVSSSTTVAGWAGTPLRDLLGALLVPVLGDEVPIHVQNDADAHALGEVSYGAAPGPSALVVAVGTGVGAGLVLDGQVLRGAHSVAGEIAHLPISGADHLRCTCGRPGHLDALGSGVGMVSHHRWLGGDEVVVDARGIVARAQAREPLALRAVEDSAAAVGRAIAAVMTLVDPGCVVVTGGLGSAGPIWWTPMETALRAELIDALTDVEVRPGQLGGRGPLLGAATSAWALAEATP